MTKSNDTINLNGVTVKDFNAFVGTGFFTAKFVKKDGTVRIMNCRREVKKHLKGGQSTWQPEKRGFVSVYDVQAEGYRVINLATLIELKANGKVLVNDAMRRDAMVEELKKLASTIAELDGNADAIKKVAAEVGGTNWRGAETVLISDTETRNPDLDAPRYVRYNKSGMPLW